MTIAIFALIILALAFDFLNGFHDSANSIATVVSTKVLSPPQAVAWAAFFNMLAFFFFGYHVAQTMGKGIIDIKIVDTSIIFATLLGACTWNVATWYYGLPSSSSHALIGGMIGSALVKSGPGALVWAGISKAVIFIVIAPVIGYVLGQLIGLIVYWLCRKTSPLKVDHLFRKGQLFSAALYSMGHGGNDAQKTAGLIASLLFSAGLIGAKFTVPVWVAMMCYVTIGLGTVFGGWRIVKTMGQKVAKLKPIDGFAAETSAAISLGIASSMGIPVSTTHTITGAIMGVGALKRKSAVHWGVAGNIIWAWFLTIPVVALISAGCYYAIKIFAH
jgi:inorganic phosphate transporter, PiT family